MTIKTNRFADTFCTLASPIILDHVREYGEQFGVVSLVKAEITKDRSYADLYVSASKNEDTITKFLAPVAQDIWEAVAANTQTYKIPKIRFKRMKNKEVEHSVQDLITELSKQYDLHSEH